MNMELIYAAMAGEEKMNDEMEAHVLNHVKSIVSNEVYEAIMAWVSDEDNGIFGGFEIVESELGDYQDLSHEGEYWAVLVGMWVDQYQNPCDVFYGSVFIKLSDRKYLKAGFNR